MKSRVYRQASLDQLSSPEQIDNILRITSLRNWLFLIAISLILLTACLWGVYGTVTTRSAGEGVIIRNGGVLNVTTQGGGLVVQLNVRSGDYVQAHQKIATIAQPVLVEQLRAAKQNLEETVNERNRAFEMGKTSTGLELIALRAQKDNLEQRIRETTEHDHIVEDQIKAEEDLFAKGLITKQQVLSERDRLTTAQDQIAAMQAQLVQLNTQRFQSESKPDQGVSDRDLKIGNLQLEIVGLEQQLDLAENVTTPFAGQVIEVKTSPGSVVSTGQPIISIQARQDTLEVIAYVPSIQAKRVANGMSAEISPSFVKREEFGYIKGTVDYVADYPSTPAALMHNFENESLIAALTSAGPVTEIRVQMQPDFARPNSFLWSGARSPDIKLSSGTICSVQILTRRQRPFALLFPSMKGALEF